MRRLTAVALILAGIALPACAQRGARGGFSGHAAPAFHGSFSAPPSNRFAGYFRSSGNSFGMGRGFPTQRFQNYGLARSGAGNIGARPAYTGSWRYRRPYQSPYRTGFGYGYPGYGYPGYGYPGWAYPYLPPYPDDFGDDDSQDAPNYPLQPPQGYDVQPQGAGQWEPGDESSGGPEEAAPRSVYQPASAAAHTSAAPNGGDAVTLVFKDGRAPEQIHNYMLTPTTLYVGDAHRRTIPLDQLDLAATAKANEDAGVDFHPPEASR